MEYTNSQIKALIQEHIHNEDDRKMLFLRLVNGKTFDQISEIVGRDVKTVRKRIHNGEAILFKYIPG
jgi:DNA-directed RNA polymerase specialized sigma24 family protein